MPTFKDLTDQKIGSMTVLGRADVGPSKQSKWRVKCDCGAERVRRVDQLMARCSCARNRSPSTNGAYKLPEFGVWRALRQRCNNPKCRAYKNYGGRGIRVCERWSSFVAFLADVGKRPSPRHMIDRIDNDGNYEPGNCRWATRSEQNNNKRTNRRVFFAGASLTIAEIAAREAVPYQALMTRIRSGRSAERAINDLHTKNSSAA